MAEEIVNQIIAEIIAEDQMSATLRDARKKIKAFDGDIKKLNKSLTLSEKAALEAAAAEKRLAKETKSAAVETKRLDAEAKALATDGLKKATKAANAAAAAQRRLRDETKSQVEGIKTGIGQLGISGEAMTSTFTAAAFAVGTLLAGALNVATKAVATYIEKNLVAKKSAEGLTKAWEKLQVAAVETQLGTTGVTKALDTNTARLNALTKSLAPATTEMERLKEEEDAFIQSDFTDSLSFKVSGIGLLVTATGEAIDAFDDLFEIEKETAAVSFKNLTTQLQGVGSEINKIINKAREDNAKLDREQAAAAKRRKEEQAAAAKRAAAEAKRRKEVADRLAARELSEILNINKAIADAKRFNDALNGIVATLGLLEQDKLAQISTPVFDPGVGGEFDTGDIGGVLDSIEQDLGPGIGQAQETTSLWLQETVELDSALQDLAVGGVQVMTDALGGYIEALAAGTDASFHFGDAVQLGFGSLMQQVGSGMIAMSTAALLVQSGGILANPLAGIAIGGALVASGAALTGLAKKRIGARGGSGAATAKQVAGDVADIVTSRIGNGFERQKDRAGDNIQVIIGERPIRDITVRSVREAIVNREITSLSVAGQSI